jgi:uncharacterized SAM-binding protein YcdF (DUF218 family)
MLWPFRIALKITATLLAILFTYLLVTFAQVYTASRQDHARPAQAIVVLGAAQFGGKPSKVLRARLDHAYDLWHRKLADKIMVTGGGQPGDTTTEADASKAYLVGRGVPAAAVLREVLGRSSWQSLAYAAKLLHDRGINDVLLVSDPFHSYRIQAIAGELQLSGHPSPTRTSPIKGLTSLQYMGRETVAVVIGRVVGFRREAGVHRVVTSN